MIKAIKIWFDEDGMPIYKEPHEFKNFTDLSYWLDKEDLITEFATEASARGSPDIVIRKDDFVVVIMKFEYTLEDTPLTKNI